MGGEARDRLKAALVGSAGKGNIHLAGLQQAQHLVAAAGDDLNMNGGVLLVEAVQIGQQELAGDGIGRADGQVSHLQLSGLAQLGLAGFQQADGAADIFIQQLAVGGQGDAAAVAGKKTGLEIALQLLDGLADGGLADIQRLRRGGDVASFRHFLEYLVEFQFNGHFNHPFISYDDMSIITH